MRNCFAFSLLLLLLRGTAAEIELVNGLVFTADYDIAERATAMQAHSASRGREWMIRLPTASGAISLYAHQVHRIRPSTQEPWVVITRRVDATEVLRADAPYRPSQQQPATFGWRADGNGHYVDSQAPTAFSPIWRAPMRSWSQSSPILGSDDRIFVLDEPHVLICFDKRSGKRLWERHNPDHIARPQRGMPNNDFLWETYRLTTATPITDGEHVYATFGHGVVACYDYDGTLQWTGRTTFGTHMRSGQCNSPTLVGDTLLVGGYAGDTVAGFDKRTGRQLFTFPRKIGGGKAAAITLQIADTPVGLTSGGLLVTADGSVIAKQIVGGNYGPSPIHHGDIAFIHDQKAKMFCAFRVHADRAPEALWRVAGASSRSPLYKDGIFYTGGLELHDAKHGRPIAAIEVPGGWSSPVLAGEHIVLVTAKQIHICSTGRDARLLRSFDHQFTFTSTGNGHKGTYGSTPVFDGDRWFFRDRDWLWCLASEPSP